MFFKFNFEEAKLIINNLLKKSRYYIINYFFSLIDIKEVDELLNLLLLFVFVVSLKNIKFTLLEIYLKISDLLFNNLSENENFFVYFSKRKDRKKLGKFFFNLLRFIVGDCFYFIKESKEDSNIYVKIYFKTIPIINGT